MELDSFLSHYFNRPCAPKRVRPLKGDASSRRYFRIEMGDSFAPRYLIAMVLPEDPLESDEAVSGAPPTRLPFVDLAMHLAALGIRVPEVYLDATDDRVLLIEDLGDTLLLDCVSGKDEATVGAWYEAAVNLLARMHRVMWPVPSSSIASKRSFDFDLLRWELDHYREWGLEAVFGALSPEVRKELDAAFDELAEEIAALPKGFVHRDYQSRNLMVLDPTPADRSLAVIDFQDGFEGPRIYDLVALLNDSYVDLSIDLKHRVIETYAGARGLDVATLKREFSLVTVQRKLKDGGRFVFIDRVRNNPGYLRFVEPSFQRARESLFSLQGQERLKKALAAADPNRFGEPSTSG